ncbi:MAG TPA: DUF2628 domain-containing protein [Bauldia sp.]|nr:DUF2628 domain-containing protein [Bauldia sp.]
MAVYAILAPQAGDGSSLPEPMDVVFVKDGFNWPALFFAGPWLIYRRMWLTLIGYIIAAVAVTFAAAQISDGYGTLAGLAVHLLFALEANQLRMWTLERNGYRLIAVSEGRNVEEAEIRYFSEAEVAMPPAPPAPPAPPSVPRTPQPPVSPSAEAGDVVGLFPAPGAPA